MFDRPENKRKSILPLAGARRIMFTPPPPVTPSCNSNEQSINRKGSNVRSVRKVGSRRENARYVNLTVTFRRQQRREQTTPTSNTSIEGLPYRLYVRGHNTVPSLETRKSRGEYFRQAKAKRRKKKRPIEGRKRLNHRSPTSRERGTKKERERGPDCASEGRLTSTASLLFPDL